MKRQTALFVFSLTTGVSLLFAARAEAASHYVRADAGGNGSGSDWTNAYTALPTTLIRGDIYYVADGVYGGYSFDDAELALQPIVVLKATAADHGTEVGWDGSYGDGQARFGRLVFSSDYYVFDGNRSNGYGFLLQSAGGTDVVNLGNYGAGTSHNTIKSTSIDCQGAAGQRAIFAADSDNLVLSNVEAWNCDNDLLGARNLTNLVIEGSHFHTRNNAGVGTHGDAIEITSSSNVTIRNTIFDWAGQILFFGGDTSGANGRFDVYGNVFSGGGNSGQGIVRNSSGTGGPINVYNNTFYGLDTENIESGMTYGGIVNNLFVAGADKTAGATTGRDYNYYTDDYTDYGADPHHQRGPSILSNPAQGDYALSVATNAGADLLSFQPLYGSLVVDRNGRQRGADGVWDRGAFEFSANAPPPPNDGGVAPVDAGPVVDAGSNDDAGSVSDGGHSENIQEDGGEVGPGGVDQEPGVGCGCQNVSGLLTLSSLLGLVVLMRLSRRPGHRAMPSQRGSVTLRNVLRLFALLVLVASEANAANHYVRAGAAGADNGSDWTNAYASLPPTLVRGDTYYVADGAYGSYTFNDQAASTSLITVKKATSADHGTNTGWDETYGDGQAIFTGWVFDTSYWLVDGQTGGGPGSWEADHGFRVKTTGGGAKTVRVNADNVEIRHADLENSGMDVAGSGDTVYTLGAMNLRLSHCWLHNTNRTNVLVSGPMDGFVLEYSLVSERHNTDGLHGEHMSINNTGTGRNNVIRHNIFRNAGGANTGVIVIKDSVQSGWKIYGNVFYNTPGFPAVCSDGIITDTTGDSSTDIKIYNNTFLPHPGINGNATVVSWDVPTGNAFKNNVVFGGSTVIGVAARDFNLWDSSAGASQEANGQYWSAGQNALFKNPSAYDYTLQVATDAADSTIGSEYSVDMLGVVRGSFGVWDRGAFEFSAAAPPPPNDGGAAPMDAGPAVDAGSTDDAGSSADA
ncbi:MAG: hypothetical protein ACOZIN_04445, partial [Myxococcota bacterium]